MLTLGSIDMALLHHCIYRLQWLKKRESAAFGQAEFMVDVLDCGPASGRSEL